MTDRDSSITLADTVADTYALANPSSPGPPTSVEPSPLLVPRTTPAAEPAEPGGLLERMHETGLTTTLPAWGVSAIVHFLLLSVLAMATIAPHLQRTTRSIDAAPFDPRLSGQQTEEMLSILADPAEVERDQAVGPVSTSLVPSGASGFAGLTTTGLPTPAAELTNRGPGAPGAVSGSDQPRFKLGMQLSSMASVLPTQPALDLNAGGKIAGNVTQETGSIGEALDQLAREILRHLEQNKLTVVWLFDESGSMRDDQQAIKDKFDRVASELNLNLDADRQSAGALNHLVVGFGVSLHYELSKPTSDLDEISRAIDRLPVDETGIENTMGALQQVISSCSRLMTRDRKLMIVLVTDESGDDGGEVEDTRRLAMSKHVPIYVIGRQSMFGYDRAHLLYIDPVTGDHYWPAIHRGPETAFPETLQWDGLHERRDEQPSGFAPYELARIVKDSGGIYFLLPSEENTRVHQREKAYSMRTLKEYVPDSRSRDEYLKQRNTSELRRTLAEIIEQTRGVDYKRHFPVDLSELETAIGKAAPLAQQRLKSLMAMEDRLRSLKFARDHEPERRWQAHYDLILAQIVTYQIQAYEYLACLDEMVTLAGQGKLVPEKPQVAGERKSEWVLDHARPMKAPKHETEKKVAEATALLQAVISKHPKTPWADLAQDELDRGFGVARREWSYNPKYTERNRLVPKY